MSEPVFGESISVIGNSLAIHEWKGSGPEYMHVHYEDDEAWHVLEGTLEFRFKDRTVDAPKGTTVFVPAGVPHTYSTKGQTRYLMILTPRLNELISELHKTPFDHHAEVMKKYKSEIV
ncbi:MAG TPA: cupin domain-containing protein [Pyrinomonadaceae bacterium]|nr:cupin domain-containing protein [Pyrinomonadaceae bacterium]